MAVSASVQVRSLAKAVATAFAAAPLSDEERRPARIAITDLPWACPPLITSLVLEGTSMQDHFDAPVAVEPRALHRFWTEALRQMWHEPSRVLKNGAYASLGSAMPRVRLGQRAFRFSAPVGAPSQIDVTAAVTLSLEVAQCALVSFPVFHVEQSDDSYVVELPDGMRFGVENGRPLVDSPFVFDARGQVIEMLHAPRGAMTDVCHYDSIAAVRSVLYSHPASFAQFDAVDQALQALRYLSLGGYCPELTTAMVAKPMEILRLRELEAVYFEALDVIRAQGISDRAKLETLRQLLVPAAMSIAKFKREIFSAASFPFSMAPGRTEQIEANLVTLYQSEVPQGLQRPI